jgi:hypothetical protein
MRVLVAYEHRYRFYREVIARAISDHRPQLQVRHSELEELGNELVLFDPHAVVSSQPYRLDTTNTLAAWVELPVEPSSPAEIHLGGKHLKASKLTLAEVLCLLDEAEGLLRDDPSL